MCIYSLNLSNITSSCDGQSVLMIRIIHSSVHSFFYLWLFCRNAESIQEQPQPEERASLTSSPVSPGGGGGGSQLTGSSAALREQGTPNHAPRSQHSQRLAEREHRVRQSHLQLAAHRLRPRQQLAPPPLHSHAFQSSTMFSPLGALRGGGLLGARPVWSGGLTPAGAAALVWGFQPGSVNFLAGYNNPGQGSGRYRGGQR